MSIGDFFGGIAERARPLGSFLSGVGREVYRSTPFDNAYRLGEELFKPVYGGKTNWKNVGKEAAIGGLEAGLLVGGAGAGLRAAGPVGFRQALKAAGRGAISPGKISPANFVGGNAARRTAMFLGPVGPLGAVAGYGINKALGPAGTRGAVASPPPAASGRQQPSAADWRRFIEEDKLTSFGSSAVAEESVTPGSTPATGATPPPAATGGPGSGIGGLVGLSPEQLRQLALEERALQREYDQLLAGLSRQEAAGQAEAGQAQAAALRAEQTRGQDFGTALAGAGLGTSPAAAISAEQSIARERAAQDVQTARTLAGLLAELSAGRASAKSNLSRGKLSLRERRNQMRIDNTLAEQARLYGMVE